LRRSLDVDGRAAKAMAVHGRGGVGTGGGGYLSQRSLGGGHLVEHPEGDAHDGGERQQPAHEVAPPRVHVLVVVLQRRVLDDGERKGALQGERDTKTKYRTCCYTEACCCHPRNRQMDQYQVITLYQDILMF